MKKLFPVLYLLISACYFNTACGQAVATVNKPTDSATLLFEAKQTIQFTTRVIKTHSNLKALPGMYFLRGKAHAVLKQYPDAIQDLSSAILTDLQLLEAYWERGLCYEKTKNHQSALTDYKKALSLVKNNPMQVAVLNNNIAIVNRHLKHIDQAIKSDSIAIAAEPRYTAAYINRAELYMLTGKYQLAIEDLTTTLNSKNTKQFFSMILSNRADAKRMLKKYKDAINDYSYAIGLDPNNKLAYWNRAAAYNQNGDYQLADDDYSKAIVFYKGDNRNLSRLYDDRALMEMGLQQYKKAIADDSLAISLDNQFAAAYWNKANAHAQNGDYQLGIDGYTKTMNFYQKEKKALSQLYNDIANEEYFLNEFQKVIDAGTSAILLDDQSWSPYLNRGRAYLKKNNKDLAISDFNKILTMDTTKRSFEYAYALFYTGSADKAINVMQSNLLATTNGSLLMSHYYNLACLFSLMNKPDEANIYLKKCIDGGYSKKYALTDTDLDNIKNTPEFKDIVGGK
jgi:tetratricopeptide (TPR) repeat protein